MMPDLKSPIACHAHIPPFPLIKPRLDFPSPDYRPPLPFPSLLLLTSLRPLLISLSPLLIGPFSPPFPSPFPSPSPHPLLIRLPPPSLLITATLPPPSIATPTLAMPLLPSQETFILY